MYVFVYGTLRTGQSNYKSVEKYFLEKPRSGLITATMYDLGDFPTIVLKGDGIVYGEWINVDKEGLEWLDWLEEYPKLYSKDYVYDLKNGLSGFSYHMNVNQLRRIEYKLKIQLSNRIISSGDWVEYYSDKKSKEI